MRSNPFLLNINKPKDMTSFQIVRFFKRKFGKQFKIGHFGTLDPFAQGVLILGLNGAQKLNDYVHKYLPKTYVAHGILGQRTVTGDLTSEIDQSDESDYLRETIAEFSKEFIQDYLRKEFLGEYLQAPHQYSAAKFEGKALHKWAREGVEIKKEKKLRHIYNINIVDYSFPKLTIEFEVSSGTYIRTLFEECAQKLGTLGVLEDLIRTKVGCCTLDNALSESSWEDEEFKSFQMDEILKFPTLIFASKEARLYSNGVRLNIDRIESRMSGEISADVFWVKDQELNLLGLAELKDDEIYTLFNFS